MIYDKKICLDIMSDHIWDLVGGEQMFGWPMSNDQQLFVALFSVDHVVSPTGCAWSSLPSPRAAFQEVLR